MEHFSEETSFHQSEAYLICFCYLLLLSIVSKQPGRVGALVFNATINNISVISVSQVLLVEENVVPRENHQPV